MTLFYHSILCCCPALPPLPPGAMCLQRCWQSTRVLNHGAVTIERRRNYALVPFLRFVPCASRRHVLSEVLAKHSRAVDFGRQIIPEIIREGYKVCVASRCSTNVSFAVVTPFLPL